MDTITVTNHADIEFVVVVNTKWWNGLSKATQGHIRAAAKVAQESVRDAMTQIEADAYAAAKANGMKVVKLSDKELDAWKAVSKQCMTLTSKRQVIWVKKILDAASN